ncbi:MAG: hypothetical protein AVDCRST_MAG95-1846 [uncultured Adhaeribacter sp.]|uniref:Uncharacterized protein n=1 Tax=uncultured Adhaeribacter sp. TaxID=448109 RepID=A0A6J4IH85_9BACT|nr:MAG: hypothetical protein AVDCRST_MAG95-1846 [uncultured Adhaeribacter sp.]
MKQDFKLEDLPKQKIYPVPDGYFEKLPGVIMSRVAPQEVTPVRTWLMGWYAPYRVAFTSAALTFGFAGVFWLAQEQPTGELTNSMAILPQISHTEVIDYVASIETLDSRDLAELNLTETDVSPEFIKATTDDILNILEDQPLEEVYFN